MWTQIAMRGVLAAVLGMMAATGHAADKGDDIHAFAVIRPRPVVNTEAVHERENAAPWAKPCAGDGCPAFRCCILKTECVLSWQPPPPLRRLARAPLVLG